MSAKSIINIAVLLILAVLALAIFANSMTKPIGRDEQMYCTGGVLMAQGKMIYRDFSYVAQMPYHPLLYATAFKILNTTHYLLVGRIISSLCDILVMVFIVVIYRHIFRSFPVSGSLFGLAGAVLYVFNPLVDYANGYAWNNDVVTLCVVLSLWLFISTDFKHKSMYWRVAAIGALLTFATFMRITTALIELIFFLCLLIRPAESVKQRLKTALLFLIAAACVSVWPVWVIAHAPRAFFVDVFSIHILNSQWLSEIGMVHDKFNITYNCLTTPGYFVLILMAVYLSIIILWQRRKLTISHKKRQFRDTQYVPRATGDGLLTALLPLAFFVIALILPTIWKQYLAMPVPFLIIGFACPLQYLRQFTDKINRRINLNKAAVVPTYIAVGLLALSTFTAVVSYPIVLERILILSIPESWQPIRLHKISKDIALKTKDPKLILTLAPLYALEGRCDIYPEFSAGPFVYRVADSMTPSDRAVTHAVGPKTLKELVEKSPPSAVILGVEMAFLEESIFRAVVEPDQQKWERKVYENGTVAFFRL